MSDILTDSDFSDFPTRDRIRAIPTLFQECRIFADKCDDHQELASHLNQYNVLFRPIAYEAASMGLAIGDILNHSNLKRWKSFLAKNRDFNSHIHVGLGWAMARLKTPITDMIELLETKYVWRVWDGWGYHDGFFKRRTDVDASWYHAYCQGFGRSLWHEAFGDARKLNVLASGCPEDHRASVWIGIGVAAFFIGGVNQDTVEQLMALSGKYRNELLAGLVFAVNVRNENHCLTDELRDQVSLFLGHSIEDILQLVRQSEPSDYTSENYHPLLKKAILSRLKPITA